MSDTPQTGFIVTASLVEHLNPLGFPCSLGSDGFLWIDADCATVFPTRAAARKAISQCRRKAKGKNLPWSGRMHRIVRLVFPATGEGKMP